MDVSLICGLCETQLNVEEITEVAQVEYLMDVFARMHGPHTPEELDTFIWANGKHPAGKALDYPDMDDDEDGEPGA